MGFISFIGRVTFSAIFILAAWQKIQDFGDDGGSTLKTLEPKLDLFRNHVFETLHFKVPPVETKHLLMGAIALEGFGGLLFTVGSSVGAYLLLIFLAAVTPIVHDFYNYDLASPEYVHQFNQFLKNLALFGALLFFLGMRNSTHRQIRRKQASKSKSVRTAQDSKSSQLHPQNVEKPGNIHYIRRTTHKNRTRKQLNMEDTLSKETLPTIETLNQESMVAQISTLRSMERGTNIGCQV